MAAPAVSSTRSSAQVRLIWEEIKNYNKIFKDAITQQYANLSVLVINGAKKLSLSREQPSEGFSEDEWEALRSDYALMKRLAYIAENNRFIKFANQNETDLEILPAALELAWEKFCRLMTPLVSTPCQVFVQGFEYSSHSIASFCQAWEPKELKDLTQKVSCSLKGGVKVDLTLAKCELLHLKIPKGRFYLDFPEIDAKTFWFAYEAIADRKYEDTSWFYSYTNNQKCSLLYFLATYCHEGNFSYIYSNCKDVINAMEIKVSLDDEKDLQNGVFAQKMKILLDGCPKAERIRLTVEDNRYPLVFSRQKFEQLLNENPEGFLVKRTLELDDGNFEIDADFYHEFLTVFSMKSGIWKKENISLLEYNCKTLMEAIDWFKTGQYPAYLSWHEHNELYKLVDYCNHGSFWHNEVQTRFSMSLPCLTEQQLQNLSWQDLAEQLAQYEGVGQTQVQIEEQFYPIAWVLDLAQLNLAIPCSELGKTLHFRVKDKEEIVQGNFYVYSLFFKASPYEAAKGTPILIEKLSQNGKEVLTRHVLRDLENFPFRLLEQLHDIFTLVDIEEVSEVPGLALRQRIKIYLAGPLNWMKIKEDLNKYPNAKTIQLQGSPFEWTRDEVNAFITHGAITVDDLNTTLQLRFLKKSSSRNEWKKVPRALWKCFSMLDPSSEGIHLETFLGQFNLYWNAFRGIINSIIIEPTTEEFFSNAYCKPLEDDFWKQLLLPQATDKIQSMLGQKEVNTRRQQAENLERERKTEAARLKERVEEIRKKINLSRSFVEQLKERWQKASQRERIFVVFTAAMVCIAAIYGGRQLLNGSSGFRFS